ncbi:MAG: helix-turn-helix transcriptional regulator [Clostridia bacterium]|nr:helix-turn-helix transcriptional regulator [Clostridia bacterium]
MLNHFAENLADILRIKGMTQKELADCLGVGANTVNQWIKTGREPTYDILLRICIALDTSPDELLGYQRAKEHFSN